MSVDGATQAAVVIGGATLVAVLAGGLIKAASLRGDMNQKWSSRIDLAAVALDEKTLYELKQLRSEIDEIMPEEDAPFDPGQAIVDPSPLSERVEKTAKFYRARVGMERDLAWILRLGRVLVLALTALIVAVAILTIHYGDLIDWRWLRWAGSGVGAVATGVLIVAGGTYVVCSDHLSSGEILADSAARAGDDGGTV